MSLKKLDPKFLVLLGIILFAAALRLPDAAQLTPWASYSPIGAMALFGGTYFSRSWKAYLFPVLAMFLSDLAINVFIFDGKYGVMYDSWYWTYAAFAVMVFAGTWIRRITPLRVIGTGVAGVLLYWLLIDFGVWFSGGIDIRTGLPLSRDWNGIMQVYVQGFPYILKFLAGTLVYSAVMFGGFELLQRRFPKLRMATVK